MKILKNTAGAIIESGLHLDQSGPDYQALEFHNLFVPQVSHG